MHSGAGSPSLQLELEGAIELEDEVMMAMSRFRVLSSCHILIIEVISEQLHWSSTNTTQFTSAKNVLKANASSLEQKVKVRQFRRNIHIK